MKLKNIETEEEKKKIILLKKIIIFLKKIQILLKKSCQMEIKEKQKKEKIKL